MTLEFACLRWTGKAGKDSFRFSIFLRVSLPCRPASPGSHGSEIFLSWAQGRKNKMMKCLFCWNVPDSSISLYTAMTTWHSRQHGIGRRLRNILGTKRGYVCYDDRVTVHGTSASFKMTHSMSFRADGRFRFACLFTAWLGVLWVGVIC